MKLVKLTSKKGNCLEDEGENNCLKLMKREILVEIWLKLANGDRKEVRNQKRVFECWHPTGGNTHESQENT